MHTTSASPENLVGIATLVEILQRSRASIYRDINKQDASEAAEAGQLLPLEDV